MSRPVTNDGLDALLAEAGYDHGHAAFARQVNLAAHDRGNYRYDASSVYWWLRGRRPEPDVQTAMTEVLARKLGRTVRVDELGFGAVDPRLGFTYPGDFDTALRTTTDLWRVLVHRRDVLVGVPFVAAAAIEAAVAWRYDPRDASIAGRRTAGHRWRRHRVAPLGGPVRRPRPATRQRRASRPRLAGGVPAPAGRPHAARLLHRHGRPSAPRRRGFAHGATRLDVLRAGDCGMAQRYFITALRLAKAGDDELYGAHLLANMATQAVFLGQPRTAVRLARAAIDGAGRAPTAVLARLYTAEASAHAVAGDKTSCTTALRRAERAVARTNPGEDRPGPGTSLRPTSPAPRCAATATSDCTLRPCGMPTPPSTFNPAECAPGYCTPRSSPLLTQRPGTSTLRRSTACRPSTTPSTFSRVGYETASTPSPAGSHPISRTASVATYLERVRALPEPA